jgi:ADP-ribose diphosphatase
LRHSLVAKNLVTLRASSVKGKNDIIKHFKGGSLGANRERVLNSQEIFQGRAIKVRVDTVEKPGGRETTREIVEHDDCVAIVAIDNEENILLVRQFREAVGEELLEIPAGGIDRGENAAQAVRRELREETGYLPRKLKKLRGFYSAPGYSTEYLHLYLATELTLSPLEAEDTESIELVRVPFADIPSLIASGKIYDAKSIAGLLSTWLIYRR